MNKASFFHQFAALLNAGFSVSQSLLMAAQQEARSVQPFLQKASRQVDAGQTLAIALKSASSPFSDWEIHLLHLGETCGALATTSQQLATLTEVHQRRARLYGSVMVSVEIIGLVLLFGISSLIWGNTIMVQMPRIVVVGVLFVVVLLFKDQLQLSGDLGLVGHRLSQKIPGLGRIVEARSLTTFAELALPLRCGVSIAEGLELVRPRIPDPAMAKTLATAAQQIRSGQSLSQSLAGRLPAIALQFVRTGEETGALDLMLEKMGQHYEQELERHLRQLEGILRPLSLLMAGLLVLMLGLNLLSSLFSRLPQ